MVNKRFILKERQTGSALIIGLTILFLMLILGTAGMRTSIMEERMAGNARDYNNAFQAGEIGLIDGEQDVLNKDPITHKKLRDADFYTLNSFAADCNIGNTSTRLLDGLCKAVSMGSPQWLSIDWNAIKASNNDPLPYREYGDHTKIGGNPPTPLPPYPSDPTKQRRQPRYVIEYLASVGSRVVGRGPTPQNIYYRITTQGYGIAMTDDSKPIARIMLQSTYGL